MKKRIRINKLRMATVIFALLSVLGIFRYQTTGNIGLQSFSLVMFSILLFLEIELN